MRITFFRTLTLYLLVAVLAVPFGALSVLAQQQQPPPQQQDPKKQEQKKEEPQKEYAITVDVPVVSVDVVVTDNRGNYVSGLKKDNFRVLEDGVPQQITNFQPTEAPITIVVLIEFSKLGYEFFAYKSVNAAYGFLGRLNKDDWVALVSYDIRPRIEVDFTRNKMEVQQHLTRMYFPGFSESNIFDALIDTLDRLQDVKGKKAILLLGTGIDTFSKNTLDKTLNRLKQTDVSVFTVSVAREFWEYFDNRGQLGPISRMSFLQAENQLRAFADLTGGRAWTPRFDGELRGIFQDVAESLRNQYSLGYAPSNKAAGGKFRKIKVQLVGEDGTPLVIKDQNNKVVKYVIYAREGYLPPKGVGD